MEIVSGGFPQRFPLSPPQPVCFGHSGSIRHVAGLLTTALILQLHSLRLQICHLQVSLLLSEGGPVDLGRARLTAQLFNRREVLTATEEVASGLKNLGLEEGSRVGIYADTACAFSDSSLSESAILTSTSFAPVQAELADLRPWKCPSSSAHHDCLPHSRNLRCACSQSG